GLAFGGIAPVVSCSRTVPQRSPAALLEKAGSSWSTRNFPLAFSGPWHSRQWVVRIGRILASKSGLRPAGASCPWRTIGRRPATIARIALMAFSSPRLGYPLFLVAGRVTREIGKDFLLFGGLEGPEPRLRL